MYTRCSEYEYFWKSKQTSRFKDGVVKLKGAFEGKNVEHNNICSWEIQWLPDQMIRLYCSDDYVKFDTK